MVEGEIKKGLGEFWKKERSLLFIHQCKSPLRCKHSNGTGEIKKTHVLQLYFSSQQFFAGDLNHLMYLFIPNTDTRPFIKRIQRSIDLK
ncbi:MAG: hypothetical protein BWY13_01008 [Euryarchaeota archaeon ADurb.Bin190]|nr:MAG: hypothetical protein BWY13_01008 [Euryarchaeota archaeon ADurb.Bin190]